MSVKDQIKAIQNALNEAHEDGPSQALDRAHQLLWDFTLAHYAKVGLSKCDLREIANGGNMQALGGGTSKTPPPPE